MEHDEERQAIAKNGQEKVKEEHSYAVRLQQIIKLSIKQI
ncbi:MAG: glycosyltransferase [Lachnospiraceae bacterium]